MKESVLALKNGTLKLPRELQKSWKGAEIFVRFSPDTVILKKVQPGSFWTTWEAMKSKGRGVSRKDIENAIQWARKKK